MTDGPGPRLAVCVLAAGAARRMGGVHKLLLPFGDGPLIRRSVEKALGAGGDRTAVVTGRGASEVTVALSDLPLDLIENPAFEDGLATSLTCALNWAEPIADGLVILLGDEPGIDAAVIRRAIGVWTEEPDRPVRVKYTDRPGHPVILPLPVSVAPRLVGDRGMRDLLDQVREVSVDAPAPIDVDTRTDYQEALARLRQ